MTATQLFASVRSRLAKATPGPWVNEDMFLVSCGAEQDTDPAFPDICVTDTMGSSPLGDKQCDLNADLIAHAPTDLSRLLAVVDVLWEALQLIDMRKEGFEEDLVRCPMMAFDAMKEAREIAEGKS